MSTIIWSDEVRNFRVSLGRAKSPQHQLPVDVLADVSVLTPSRNEKEEKERDSVP